MYEWITSHICVSRVKHSKWVMAHAWMSRVALKNESCHTHEPLQGTRMNDYMCEWIISHIWIIVCVNEHWINKTKLGEPQSTSNQSSKPCTVLQYPYKPCTVLSTHESNLCKFWKGWRRLNLKRKEWNLKCVAVLVWAWCSVLRYVCCSVMQFVSGTWKISCHCILCWFCGSDNTAA